MFSKRWISWLSRSQWISVVILASAVGIAGAVSLTTFTAGTQISATAVNANFTALNNALPQVWASTDSTSGGVTITATSTPQTINSVSITAPAAGHLILSGSVYVNNDSTVPVIYNLNPLIDGVGANNATFEAATQLAADTSTSFGDVTTLAYTMTTPVTAGTHTVSQQLSPLSATTGLATSASYFYNRYNLTVVFIPSISGFTAAEAPFSGQAASGKDEHGLVR